MAFNPFNAFRKYSKVMFAVLAIICMFVFVLSSGIGGGGDFFDQVMRMGGAGRGAEVAKIFGEPVTVSDIERIRAQRQIANTAMIGYIQRTNVYIAQLTKAELDKLSPEVNTILNRIITAKLVYSAPLETDDPNMVRQSQFRYFQELPQARFALMSRMQSLKEDEKPQDFVAIRRIMHMLETDQFINQSAMFGFREPFFFTNLPMDTDRDILEFIMWTRKAERMGILVQPEEVKRQVARETHDMLRGSDASLVEAFLRREFAGFNSSVLMSALQNEFQVRIAMASTVGRTFAGGSAVPGNATPREFFDFFKDQCSETKYFTLQMPVDKFDAAVTETPTDADLRKLYTEYRTEEPDPARATPGFKDPRKVSVEWVSGNPESDYYLKQASLMLKLSDHLGPIFGVITLPDGGGVVSGAFSIGAPFTFAEAAALVEYDRYLDRRLRWTDSLNPELRDNSVIKPVNIAGLIGQSFGSIATGAGPFSAPMLFERMAIESEIMARVRVGLPLVLAALGHNHLNGVMTSAAGIPADLPAAALRAQFGKIRQEVMARQLYLDDMRNIYAEVAKLGGKPTAKADIAAYLDPIVKSRGLQVGRSGPPQDKFQISADPGLTPLREVFEGGHSSRMSANDPMFGESFFDNVGASERKTFLPKWYPREPLNAPGAPKVFLTWRTEDVEPTTKPFDEVRDRVVKAWQRIKAREKALLATEKLGKDVQAFNGNRAKLLDYAQTNGLKWNELGPAAKLLQEPGLADGPKNYRPYRIPNTFMEFPAPEATDKLLSIRKENIGANVILNDAPLNSYYLAILVQRDEKTEADFADVYSRLSTPISRDPLFSQHMQREVMRQTNRDIIELLKAEANYSESEEFVDRLSKSVSE